jgi:hypothetical protein
MDIKGKIIRKLDPQGGTSKAGREWKKQEYVMETLDSAFPRQVKFDFFGDRADQYPLEVGDVITLSFDIESREFNGRWYTDIRGFKAMKEDPNMAPAPQAPAPSEFAPAPPADGGMPAPPPVDANDFGGGGTGDDLPF